MKGKLHILMVLALPLALASCKRAPESTGIEYAPEMYHAIALEPYSQQQDSYAPFADRMNAQASVPGTISREGWADYPYAENDTLGHKTNPNPLPNTPEVLAQGEVLYLRYCGICHGKTGTGDGKVAEKDEINPPSFLDAKYMAYTPGQFYHVIYYGKNVMGSYASQLTHDERWKVIHYIKSTLQATKGAAPDSAAAEAIPGPPPPSDDPVEEPKETRDHH